MKKSAQLKSIDTTMSTSLLDYSPEEILNIVSLHALGKEVDILADDISEKKIQLENLRKELRKHEKETLAATLGPSFAAVSPLVLEKLTTMRTTITDRLKSAMYILKRKNELLNYHAEKLNKFQQSERCGRWLRVDECYNNTLKKHERASIQLNTFVWQINQVRKTWTKLNRLFKNAAIDFGYTKTVDASVKEGFQYSALRGTTGKEYYIYRPFRD